MTEKITDYITDPNRINCQISTETRAFMAQMLEFADCSPDPIPLDCPANPISSQPLSSIIPTLMTLAERILEELENNLTKLFSLNPSRREAIAQHLERLSGSSSPPPLVGSTDPMRGLRRWVEGARSTSQNDALRTYFEEITILALGQAILLKSWSDRGIRRWSESDLGRLNWALSTSLKPFIPIDREGWQITRPNLYSWYNPTPRLQHEIWSVLEPWRIADEGPPLLIALVDSIQRTHSDNLESVGYDTRFFQCLWKHIISFRVCPGLTDETGIGSGTGLKRNKVVFSPTLRNGTMVRTSPPSLVWVGMESSPFQLMIAELFQIWWEPISHPLWSIGTGLEVHNRDQLALALSSPKPSVISRIGEMEACDIAFVLEEQSIRSQGKNAFSTRFREQLDRLPYFKKLRSSGTSLGCLQACVTISKLRPGGIFWWAREEALTSKDGNEMLSFLLDRATLLGEWDFSDLEHALPAQTPLYPKHLYLFQREPDIETRLSHRPIRHSIQGQLRSHIELDLVLEDAFESAYQPTSPRGHWTIHSYVSPTTQRDWIEKWPDPTSQSMVRRLDQLRTSSLPLANFTTIRPSPEGNSTRNGKWSIQLSLRGFWITADSDSEGRKLICHPLPRPGEEIQGTGFLVLVSDDAWIAPLSAFLMSDIVKTWLDHHAERRGDRWILNEQVVKWLPIPKSLLQILGVPASSSQNDPLSPIHGLALPKKWERLVADLNYQPHEVLKGLGELTADEEENRTIHSTVFVSAARALDQLCSGQNRLFSIVTPEGKVRWGEIFNILPKGECVAISLHPKIRLSGSLPPHLPIGRMDRVKSPSPGILLITESGFNLHIGSEMNILINMIWEQLEGLVHPTWNELLQDLRLPRKIELAETTAVDILRSHEEQAARRKEFQDLLSNCQLF